jgi:hypothetical protein
LLWKKGAFLSVLAPSLQNERQGGGEDEMKISAIEALAPASSTTKGN